MSQWDVVAPHYNGRVALWELQHERVQRYTCSYGWGDGMSHEIIKQIIITGDDEYMIESECSNVWPPAMSWWFMTEERLDLHIREGWFRLEGKQWDSLPLFVRSDIAISLCVPVSDSAHYVSRAKSSKILRGKKNESTQNSICYQEDWLSYAC